MIGAKDLKQFSLLATLNPALLDELAAISEEQTAESGEWLFHDGETATALYFILSGRVELRVKLDEKATTNVTLNALGAGDALGWSALVAPYVYRLGAFTASSVRLVRMDADKVRTALEKYPDQGYILMQGIAGAMAQRVEVFSEQIPELSTRAAVVRGVTDVSVIASVILVIVFGFFILYAAAGGYGSSVPVFLCCAAIPVAILLFARFYYSRNKPPSGQTA